MIFILFLFLSSNFISCNDTPTLFTKYWANVTNLHPKSESSQNFNIYYGLWIDSDVGNGRQDQTNDYPSNRLLVSFFRTSPLPDNRCYAVFYQQSPPLCKIIPTILYDFDVIREIIQGIESKGEQKDCQRGFQTVKCNTWIFTNKTVYWSYASDDVPFQVYDNGGTRLYLEFTAFKYGKDAFDDKTAFHLPVDPSTCH